MSGRDAETTTGRPNRADPFLFIAGVTRSGTTSLFRYLSAHSGVCPCRIKEPSFFLPSSIPSPPGPHYDNATLDDYLAQFDKFANGQIALEATALYFSVAGVASRIAGSLSNTHAVVSFRDPIDRLRSAYQMAQFHGWLPRDLSFEGYAGKLLALRADSSAPFIYRHPLQEGLYAEALRSWREALGTQRILTVWFNDLENDAASVVARISRFAGLAPGFYEGFSFKSENPSVQIKYHVLRDRYSALRRQLGAVLSSGPARAVSSQVARRLDALLDRVTTKGTKDHSTESSTAGSLRDFYRADVQALAKLVGQDPPWLDRYLS